MKDTAIDAGTSIPDGLLSSWQDILNILAKLFDVPASLIMRLQDDYITVFLAGENSKNPYMPGSKEHFDNSGLYCETVIKTRKGLLVPNALKDAKWKYNPDIKLNMISYLGLPIHYPDNSPFGTICVLDTKENHYSDEYIELLTKFRDSINRDLDLLQKNSDLTVKNEHINSLLQEKELILKEVHHRIKNNMYTVQTLLELQAEMSGDKTGAAILVDAAKRIGSMTLLYDTLYRSSDFLKTSLTEYLSLLIDSIIDNFAAGLPISFEKKLADITIDAKLLQPLGLIVNELLTNAIKHAFTESASGKIFVELLKTDTALTLTIQDNGKGIPANLDFDKSTGFGLLLIKALTEQLSGKITLDRSSGTRFTLTMGL